MSLDKDKLKYMKRISIVFVPLYVRQLGITKLADQKQKVGGTKNISFFVRYAACL